MSYLSAPSGFAINFFMDDLLQRIARDRDPMAFQELFRLYGPRIKAMMMRQGADAASEDIAEEALSWSGGRLISLPRKRGASQPGFIPSRGICAPTGWTAGALSGFAQRDD
jgi:hypothetical protein